MKKPKRTPLQIAIDRLEKAVSRAKRHGDRAVLVPRGDVEALLTDHAVVVAEAGYYREIAEKASGEMAGRAALEQG